MRFIVDQTQTPNLKVKVAILRYIEALARQMDPADFVNSSETRLAVSRIITWTTEPKSSDVRKVRGWVVAWGEDSPVRLVLSQRHLLFSLPFEAFFNFFWFYFVYLTYSLFFVCPMAACVPHLAPDPP